MEQKKDINNIITTARVRLGMTQAELGAAIGRSERLIYGIETGKCGLSRYVTEAVRQLLIDKGLNSDPYSNDEHELIRAYRDLSEKNKATVFGVIHGMAGTAP